MWAGTAPPASAACRTWPCCSVLPGSGQRVVALLKGMVLWASSGCTFVPAKGKSPQPQLGHFLQGGRRQQHQAIGNLRTKDPNQEAEVSLGVSWWDAVSVQRETGQRSLGRWHGQHKQSGDPQWETGTRDHPGWGTGPSPTMDMTYQTYPSRNNLPPGPQSLAACIRQRDDSLQPGNSSFRYQDSHRSCRQCHQSFLMEGSSAPLTSRLLWRSAPPSQHCQEVFQAPLIWHQ